MRPWYTNVAEAGLCAHHVEPMEVGILVPITMSYSTLHLHLTKMLPSLIPTMLTLGDAPAKIRT